MHSPSMNRLAQLSANFKQSVPFQLHAFEAIGTDFYRLGFSTPLVSNVSHDALNAELESFTGNRLSLEEASVTEGRMKGYFTAIAARNIESVPYTKEVLEGLKLVSANVFVDEDEEIWTMAGEGDQKRLVKKQDSSLDQILYDRQKRSATVANSVFDCWETEYEPQDFVRFVSTAARKVMCGFALNSNEVLATNGKTYTVPAVAVLQATGIDFEIAAKEAGLPFGNGELDIVAFYKKLFGNNAWTTNMEKAVKQFAKK